MSKSQVRGTGDRLQAIGNSSRKKSGVRRQETEESQIGRPLIAPCHPERRSNDFRSESKSKDPDNLSPANAVSGRSHQVVKIRLLSLAFGFQLPTYRLAKLPNSHYPELSLWPGCAIKNASEIVAVAQLIART